MTFDHHAIRWERAPRWIIAGTLAHLAAGLVVWLFWNPQGSFDWMRRYFRYEGALFLTLSAAVQLVLCRFVLSNFKPGEAMHGAWRLLYWSAASQLLGAFIVNILAVRSVFNPLPLVLFAKVEYLPQDVRDLGRLLAGPLSFVLLAVGFKRVIAVCRRCGILARPTMIDGIVFLVGLGLCMQQIVQIPFFSDSVYPPRRLLPKLLWSTDILLAILWTEATILRASMRRMAGGLLGKCWTSYCAAVFFTLVGNMGIWALSYGYITWPHTAFTWYIWYLASAAFALGPAYQARAIFEARKLSKAKRDVVSRNIA